MAEGNYMHPPHAQYSICDMRRNREHLAELEKIIEERRRLLEAQERYQHPIRYVIGVPTQSGNFEIPDNIILGSE